jgi:hypothetical protein
MQTFEEQLATAIVAKMANMTLRDVDDKTTHTSSSGPATRIDPMKFVHTQQNQNNVPPQHVQRQIEYTNQLAEQLCPLPPPPAPIEPITQLQAPSQLTTPPVFSAVEMSSDKVVEILTKIDDTLNKLVNVVEQAFNK